MKITDSALKIVCSFLCIFIKSRTIRHILTLSKVERNEFLDKIINENINKKKHEQIDFSSKIINSFKFVQSYNQLPCTVETRKKELIFLKKMD